MLILFNAKTAINIQNSHLILCKNKNIYPKFSSYLVEKQQSVSQILILFSAKKQQ